ncbi:type VI secretion system lipoprotein TssJ [Neisseriaceae bacterium ESL0693]|nr:type VI secretion system lipoprotein TssJ [Neisseriaceae bacterium ESL0693]
MKRQPLGYWILLCLLLSGCHMAQKGYESVRKAGTEAVTLSRYHYDFKVMTTKTLNQGNQANALTTHMQIYQLRDKARFQEASYYDLLHQADKVLDKDLVQQQTITVMPFSSQEVTGDVDQQSQYIGVVFFFHQPQEDEQSWKLLLSLKDIHLWGDNYILVDDNTARLVKKKAVKALSKEQKAEKKVQEKAAKAKQKAEKAAKKAEKMNKAAKPSGSNPATAIIK